ncbi:hypothetical protein ACIOMQ_10740 [Streptomyces sp. NPDC087845]|uniref:hypothetical protein n=1 Tax=Streptomyces sp. NPDC087845 TaxID=3365806 RepID=UPI0038108BAC
MSPRDEGVRVDLDDAEGWSAYATDLRRVLGAVMAATGVDGLEVGELLVSRPLPERYVGLRNGSEVNRAEAVDLVVGMAAGRGPYCRLTGAGRLRIESGWDGSVHLYVPPGAAGGLTDLGTGAAVLERRVVAPEPADEQAIVEAAADDEFWAAVRQSDGEMTLLCERWAYGSHGCRWFWVTSENAADIAGTVRPRSLLCVAVDPDLRLDPGLLDDDFTAFTSPLVPGELAHRTFPGGADDLAEVTDEGFSLMLRDSVMADRCAVVPDPDGTVRGRWEAFGDRDGDGDRDRDRGGDSP